MIPLKRIQGDPSHTYVVFGCRLPLDPIHKPKMAEIIPTIIKLPPPCNTGIIPEINNHIPKMKMIQPCHMSISFNFLMKV